MDQLKQVEQILLQHYGKKNSISSREIASILGISEDDTFAQTRAIIFAAAKQFKLPLAADNAGYYLITEESELFEYIGNLDNRIFGIKERKEIIIQNFKEWKK